MKRFFSCFLTLVMLLALSAPAYADIMWEPQDNQFYKQHGCTYENRSYYANGPEGFVTVWDAPGGVVVQAQYQNGEALWVGYTWQEWALISRWEDEKEITGWVPLAELSLIYDYLSFQEEYADRIRPYDGEFADYAGDAAEVNFYEYPGAEEIKQTWETDGDWHVLDNLTGTAENDSYISKAFTDEDGRTWGYVGYMYGRLNAWFCLDEPDGADFPVREVSAQELTPPQTPTLPASGYMPYILVAVVVAVTGGLLAVFYGKRRKTTK